jgi:hypothetical protein
MHCILGATLIAALLPLSAIAGINGGDVSGINGGDVNGINGGDVNGINGGDVYGINGGDVYGINGGDVNGINGGDVYGINGGDVNGINGGDVNGINGGDVLVLAGPVDSIDPINGVFMAMGQTVMASQGMLSSMSVGDFVSVNGSVVSSGWLYADSVSVANDMYVPGATAVFVPSAIDPVLGQAKLGELTIDYTAALSGGAIPAGMSLTFSGIQPANRGLLVSDAVRAVE